MRRIERVSELIKRELGSIVSRKFGANGAIITLTRVELSKDLNYADIYFSAIPDEAGDRMLSEISKDISDIQQALNRRLRMRPVPKIRFHVDEQEREAHKIDELLKGI